jgi:hypothetical protein
LQFHHCDERAVMIWESTQSVVEVAANVAAGATTLQSRYVFGEVVTFNQVQIGGLRGSIVERPKSVFKRPASNFVR